MIQRLLNGVEGDLHGTEQLASGAVEGCTVAGAIEQVAADRPFQSGDLAGHRRLAHAELAGGRRERTEAPRTLEDDEHLQPGYPLQEGMHVCSITLEHGGPAN